MVNRKTAIFEIGLLGKCIADHGDIWQMDLLNPSRMSSYIKDRDVKFWESHIKQLWQLKLLRADLVVSRRKLRIAGLLEVGFDDGYRLYADERYPRRRTTGWVNSTQSLSNFPVGVDLYFHPFRYYLLYHLQRIIKLSIHPYQMMISKRYSGVLDQEITQFQNWSSKPEFTRLVSKWNDIVSLCVLVEPCFYKDVFQGLKFPPSVGYEEQNKRIQKHWEEISHCFYENSVDKLEDLRNDLCINAEMLDKNTDVHTLLRLSQGRFRQNVKGRLGGSLLLKTMAEMMRRATEKAHDELLREEDEIGFGMTPHNMKENLYGANRLLDDARGAKQYLRSFNLDYGIRLRWYMEGDTEYGALDHVLGRYRSMELFNLKGNIVQKGRKGAAFVDNLKTDLRSQVFSFILIDADNDDYIRVVRKAAKDDLICGMFYISDPDFEFENFSLSELEEVLWEIAVENGASNSNRNDLHNAISTASSGKELIDSARKALLELNQISKGIDWGQRLIEYASLNPEMRNDDGSIKGTRPIIDSIYASIRSLSVDYYLTRKEYLIDPNSGTPVMRENAT